MKIMIGSIATRKNNLRKLIDFIQKNKDPLREAGLVFHFESFKDEEHRLESISN